VQGVETNVVLDTGTAKTIISERIINQIENSSKPNITKSSNVVHAGGDSLQTIGICTLGVTLGPVIKNAQVMVAEIKDDALLGMDLLDSHGHPAGHYIKSKQSCF